MKIKYGLKLWSTNTDLIDQAAQLINEKIFDYIELFVVPATQISPFLVDVPYIIHIAHHKFGVNIGEADNKKYNIQTINESIAWADELNAKYIILHPGHGSMEHATDTLHEITDDRLLIENMPKVGLNDEHMIGYSPEQIEELIRNSDRGLCLDMGHAIKAAVSLKKDYREYVKMFLRFEPKVFHMSDGKLSSERDEHLSFGEGEFDFEYLLVCVGRCRSKLITIETQRMDQHSLQEHVRNVDFLRNVKLIS